MKKTQQMMPKHFCHNAMLGELEHHLAITAYLFTWLGIYAVKMQMSGH